MSKGHAAFLIYLLPIVGWLHLLLLHRKDRSVMYHAKQSLTLAMSAVGALAGWAVVAGLVSRLPLAGSIIALRYLPWSSSSTYSWP